MGAIWSYQVDLLRQLVEHPSIPDPKTSGSSWKAPPSLQDHPCCACHARPHDASAPTAGGLSVPDAGIAEQYQWVLGRTMKSDPRHFEGKDIGKE